jgi:hypothetical protein
MELRKPAADGADFRFPRRPDGQPSQQRGVLVVAAHLHGVLNRPGVVFRSEPEAAVRSRHDRPHATVSHAPW